MDFLKADALPWLEGLQRQLRDAATARRLPHSILLISQPGLGADYLAQWTGAFVLCERGGARRGRAIDASGGAATDPPCGVCGACLLLRSDSHPDFHLVRLEDDAKQIKVEQVRGLIEALTTKSYRGGFKVGIIDGAETLNASGANAFLKTLEEPTDDTLLMLVCGPAHRLPATIASRCFRMTVRPPDPAVARRWLGEQGVTGDITAALGLTHGAPLLAFELNASEVAGLEADMRASLEQLSRDATDVTRVAESWLRSNPQLRLVWLENWITRRIRIALGGTTSAQTAEPVPLPGPLLKPKIRALFELQDALRELRRLASTGINQQLALEAFLLGGRTALAS